MLYLPVVIPIVVFRVTYLHPYHDLELPHFKPAGGTLLVAYTKTWYNLYMSSIQIYPLHFYLLTIYIYAWHLDLHRIYTDLHIICSYIFLYMHLIIYYVYIHACTSCIYHVNLLCSSFIQEPRHRWSPNSTRPSDRSGLALQKYHGFDGGLKVCSHGLSGIGGKKVPSGCNGSHTQLVSFVFCLAFTAWPSSAAQLLQGINKPPRQLPKQQHV